MLIDRIKQLSNEHGVTIYRVEKDCGFSIGAISKWEKSSPKAENIVKLADYFGVSVQLLSTAPGKHNILWKSVKNYTIYCVFVFIPQLFPKII